MCAELLLTHMAAMTVHPDFEPLLTVTWIARYLGVHRQTVYNWIRDGALVGGRFPGCGGIRVRRSAFVAFYESMFEPASGGRTDGDRSRYLPDHLTPVRMPEFPSATGAVTVEKKAMTAPLLGDGTPDVIALAKVAAARRRAHAEVDTALDAKAGLRSACR